MCDLLLHLTDVGGIFLFWYAPMYAHLRRPVHESYGKNSDFAYSEHKHKHKHKRKSLFKISAAWPSFTLNTTWLQPCLQHFTVQTTCLSFNIIASWCLLNENCAIPYEYLIKQCLVIDNTHFFSYYIALLFRKPVLN